MNKFSSSHFDSQSQSGEISPKSNDTITNSQPHRAINERDENAG